MAHPTGVQFSSDYKTKDWLTRSCGATENCGARRRLANRSAGLLSLKSKAPDLAATGSSASIADRTGGQGAYSTQAPARIDGTLSLRHGDASRIIVEASLSGAFAVNIRPLCSRRDLERSFTFAADALDFAELLSAEFGWPILDRTQVAA